MKLLDRFAALKAVEHFRYEYGVYHVFHDWTELAAALYFDVQYFR